MHPYFYLYVARTVSQLLIKFVLQGHSEEFLAQEEVLVDDRFAASDQVQDVYNTSPIGSKPNISTYYVPDKQKYLLCNVK